MASRIKDEIIGICSILGGIYLSISLLSFDKWDPSVFTYSSKTVGNWGGAAGAALSDISITAIGFPAFSLPVFLMIFGFKKLLSMEARRLNLAGAILFIASTSVLSDLMEVSLGMQYGAGGMAGRLGSSVLKAGLSVIGAYIVALAMFLSSAILLSPVSLITLIIRPKTHADIEYAKPEPPDTIEEREVLEPASRPVVVPMASARGAETLAKASAPAINDKHKHGYELPQLDLLNVYEPLRRQSEDDLMADSSLLERKLADFSVLGRVTHVHMGPIVTMYEFEPAPGVKINRVVSLSDDLALALKAQSIRISALPGKASIGIEIPNAHRETVSLRDILSSEGFLKSGSMLYFALGRDIFGTPVSADLLRMPHLLVAGATGAGKSVALNCMILSLLYRARPDEVKMLMIDPKLLEFSSYEGIPHLISPVVTDPKEASGMLKRMVMEMERRYKLIAEKGVKNIESFNALASADEKLPYIAVFIDELADLMLSSAAQVEDSIARLAQMARASGIHLVLATQRPSVDVITGVIKANFPARISFQVTSRIDSRTILDAQGAEQLIGKGDMLFMLPGTRMLRVHGSLVTEAEIKRVVDFVKAQGRPDYSIIQNITKIETEADAQQKLSEDRDDLYYKAVEHAEALGEVSISSIQRKLKVGYNKAARIMELMEDDGLVGPQKAAGKPRDFLRRTDY